MSKLIPPGRARMERIKGWPKLAPRWIDQQKVIKFIQTGDESFLPPAFHRKDPEK